MSPETAGWWRRALAAIEVARLSVNVDPHSAASRAYFAAFEAVQAWLSERDLAIWKHRAVREAVHRDLVRTGIWPKERGQDFDELLHWRSVGDYLDEPGEVSKEKAADLVATAERIIDAVRSLDPELFGEH